MAHSSMVCGVASGVVRWDFPGGVSLDQRTAYNKTGAVWDHFQVGLMLHFLHWTAHRIPMSPMPWASSSHLTAGSWHPVQTSATGCLVRGGKELNEAMDHHCLARFLIILSLEEGCQ